MWKSLWLALGVALVAQPALAADPCNGRVKFYRNPMGAPDTSPVPKKDSMGMAYIPVCEQEAGAAEPAGTVKLSLDRVQRLGVRTAEVQQRALIRTVRAMLRKDAASVRTWRIWIRSGLMVTVPGTEPLPSSA